MNASFHQLLLSFDGVDYELLSQLVLPLHQAYSQLNILCLSLIIQSMVIHHKDPEPRVVND